MNFHGGARAARTRPSRRYNVYPIPCGTISPEAAGWFRDEITSPEDFKGLKFRAAGVGGEIMTEYGMSVTMLPGGELYQALETGVLDATEFSLPTVDEQLGFFQVAKNYYLPGWHQPSTNQFLYVNLDVWNGLEDQTKAIDRDGLHGRQRDGDRQGRGAAGRGAQALRGERRAGARLFATRCSRPSTRPPRR